MSFLSVTGVFQLFLTCNGEDTHGYARSWVQMAWKILKEALEEWGVGGKTSSGYGRMSIKNYKPPQPSRDSTPENGTVDLSLNIAAEKFCDGLDKMKNKDILRVLKKKEIDPRAIDPELKKKIAKKLKNYSNDFQFKPFLKDWLN